MHSKKPEKGKIKPKDSRREKIKIRAELNRHRGEDVKLLRKKLD